RIGEEFLTPEQKAALPKNFVGKRGVDPAALAEIVGLPDGQAFIQAVTQFAGERAQTGLRPDAYTRRLVDAEVNRRMEAVHGKLEENILEEAKERVLAETQVDMLHEEMLARASQAGLQLTLTKEDVLKANRQLFDQTLMKGMSSDRYLAEA